MDNSTLPIVFGFILYILYVLLPLIPAIIIYKNFPDTKVGTSGVWGVLTINATGAFAAYLAVVAIGYFIIQDIQKNINASNFDNSPWFVKSKVVLLSKSGDKEIRCVRITEDSLRMKLDVKATPDYNQKNLTEVSFPMYYRDGYSKISFTYKGFETQVKTLSPDSVLFDFEHRTIYLGTVNLREITQKYTQAQEPVHANSSGTFTSMPNFE